MLADEDGAHENVTSTIPATHEDPDNSTAFMTQISPPSTQDTHGLPAYTPRNSKLLPRPSHEYNGNFSQARPFQYQEFPYHSHSNGYDDLFKSRDSVETFDFERSSNAQSKFQRPNYEKFAQRTVLLFNLPDGTTHADICESVRGGMLLDIYLRFHDNAASISFLEQADAQEFFRYVKRNDLYIRSKRVGVSISVLELK